MYVKYYKIYLAAYILILIGGYFTLGEPSLSGSISIQTYSDSLTYERLAENLSEDVVIFSVASNVLGPVLLFELLNHDRMLIFLFNVLLLIFSLSLIINSYHLNEKVFLFFVLMTPLMFFSMFNLNKEILVLLVTALFLVWLKKKGFLLMLLILLLSYFIRWQMTLFFVVFLTLLSLDYFFKQRAIILFLFILALALVYPQVSFLFEKVIEHGEVNNDVIEGSGLFSELKQIQTIVGGYFVAFLPKLLIVNFGLIKRIDMLFYFEDFWNYFVLMIHSLFGLILTIILIYKKRFALDNVLIYGAMVYGILFALTPITNVRYFLPMYFLFAVVVSEKKRGCL